MSETIILKALITNSAYLVHIATKLDVHDIMHKPYRILYDTIKHLAANSTVINSDSIMAFLESKRPGNYREIVSQGGAEWIESLTDIAYERVVNLDEHVQSILAVSFNKRMYDMAHQMYNLSIRQSTQDNPITVDEKLSEAQQMVYSLMTSTVKQKETPVLGHNIGSTIQGLLSDDESIKGISIAKYMPKFDALIKRMQPGRVVLLNSAEKIGKTTLSLELAWILAGRLGIPIAYADNEMTESELHKRLLSKLTGYTQDQLDDRYFVEQHITILEQAGKYIHDAPIYRIESGDMSEYELEANTKLLQVKHGIRALFWDYPSEMNADTKRLDKALGNKIAVLKNKIALSCNLWCFAPMQRNPTTGSIADSRDPNRKADMVLKFDDVSAEEQSRIGNVLATNKLTIEVARYRSRDGVVFLNVDKDRQIIQEV